MNPGESADEQARTQREKAERLMRSAEMWEKGAEGEKAVAAALGALGPDWIVLHDLRWPGRKFANIDHIAVGPGGIFVIDAKNWSGAITVRDGVLRQNGYRREKALAGCAESAFAVGSVVPEHTLTVTPILCFLGEVTFEGGARVVLCTAATLAERLLASPVVLTPEQVQDVATRLRSGVVPPSAVTRPASPLPPPPHAQRSNVHSIRPPRSRSARTSTRSTRRRKKARAEAISGLIAFVIGMSILSSVLKGHHSTVAGTEPVKAHKHTGTVVYRLTATDRKGTRAVSWNEGSIGTVHTVSTPALPFERTYPLARVTSPAYTINANYGGSGTITCQVTVDGAVIDTKSAKGPYGFVACTAYGNG